jgi:tRNA(fMet)-specific endonuclease VapC
MFLLDTDVYTHFRLGNHRVMARAEQTAARRDLIAITIITKIEILRGRMDALLKGDEAGRMIAAQRALTEAEEDLRTVDVVLLDDFALGHFHRLKGLRGTRRIGRADLLIVSIAFAHDATLVTRNAKHFRLVPNLKLDNGVE